MIEKWQKDTYYMRCEQNFVHIMEGYAAKCGEYIPENTPEVEVEPYDSLLKGWGICPECNLLHIQSMIAEAKSDQRQACAEAVRNLGYAYQHNEIELAGAADALEEAYQAAMNAEVK